MNAKQVLIAAVLVAVAPLAAQAMPSKQKYGEAYPLDIVEQPSTLTRAEVRNDVLSLDRSKQNFGQAFPYEQKDPMTMRLLAEVRREARESVRMYGEVNGFVGHN